MDTLPKEIKLIILSRLENKTRIIARVACKEWFNIIDHNNFKLYLTKKQDWPQIAERLAQYQKPISLHLAKNVMDQFEDINEELLKLTDLTSLELDRLLVRDYDEWLKLTTLSKLQRIECQDYTLVPPFELLNNLPNLTQATKLYDQQVSDEDLAASIERWKFLERLSIQSRSSIEFNIFTSHYSKITSLSLHLHSAKSSTVNQWLENLANLKHLDIMLRSFLTEPLVLETLTSLERLSLCGAHLGNLNTKNLTSLEYYSAEEQYIERELNHLVNLKRLTVFLRKNALQEDSNTWLTALTALENLFVRSSACTLTLHQYITSTRLTELHLEFDGLFYAPDLEDLTRLDSLKTLYIQSYTSFDMSLVSQLTSLESLKGNVPKRQPTKFSISNLTNLTSLQSWKAITFTPLPKLEQLNIQSGSWVWTQMDLPNLTWLRTHERTDFSIIPGLTSLKYLEVVRYTYEKSPCQLFSTLTALEYLNFEAGEADYEYLSTLTNLTQLSTSGPFSPSLLTLPTSLQVLNFVFDNPPSEETDNITARLPNLYSYSFTYQPGPPDTKD